MSKCSCVHRLPTTRNICTSEDHNKFLTAAPSRLASHRSASSTARTGFCRHMSERLITVTRQPAELRTPSFLGRYVRRRSGYFSSNGKWTAEWIQRAEHHSSFGVCSLSVALRAARTMILSVSRPAAPRLRPPRGCLICRRLLLLHVAAAFLRLKECLTEGMLSMIVRCRCLDDDAEVDRDSRHIYIMLISCFKIFHFSFYET